MSAEGAARVVAATIKVSLLENIRSSMSLVATIGTPLVLIALMGVPWSSATIAGFAVFSTLNATVVQVASAVAVDRLYPWDRYLRTMPAPASSRLLGKGIAILLLSALSTLAVLAVVWLQSPDSITLGPLAIAFVGCLAVSPLGLSLGQLLGAAFPPRSVGPVASATFLVLAVVGGLFGPSPAPAWLAAHLPTSLGVRLVLDWGEGRCDVGLLLAACVETLVFACLGLWLYRRGARKPV